MRCKCFVAAIGMFLGVAACSPPAVSVRPLYTSTGDGHLVTEPGVEGEWISLRPDLEDAGTQSGKWLRVRVERSRDGRYSVEVRPFDPEPGGDEITRYDVALVSLSGKLFFDGLFDEAQAGERRTTKDGYLGLLPLHVLGRVWVEDGLLRVILPASDWLKKNAPAAFHESMSYGDTDVSVITAPTDDLRKFLELHADDFGDLSPATYLCRPDADCAARAFGDATARCPDDPRAANEAAAFYSKRGDYPRAVELRRRSVALEPDNRAYRMNLGEALLLHRDFEAARSEFLTASRLEPAPSLPDDRMAWAYFLEGRFADAARASEPVTPGQRLSVDSILLHYFSLQRLGSRVEAATFLNTQVTDFRGSREDHVLLIEIQGRVAESLSLVWKLPDGAPTWRLFFYAALKAMNDGQIEPARNRLDNLILLAPKDSLIALAAKIELERLTPRQ